MPLRTLRDNFWSWLTLLCLVGILISMLWPGFPEQGYIRKRFLGHLALAVAIVAGYIIADRLGLIPHSIPRKCPKCGRRLKSFAKNYETGEVTCRRCGETFVVRKGRVVKDEKTIP
jgi:DNA-directed RNA polymerase subunit RPC12/RpoP